jgi:hypothetical protein
MPFTALGATEADSAAVRIRAERGENKLVIRARTFGSQDWIELATYVTDPKSRPYFHPLRDASGRRVLTEDRPADHPWQHGIFTGFHRVNGFNYWKEDEGHQRFVRLLAFNARAQSVSWRALVEFVAPDGKTVLEEEDAIRVYAPESPDVYMIDFDFVLRARGEDVNFGKFFVGGLSVRMPWDKANPRQAHLNSNGLRGRECEQKRAAWCTTERPFGDTIFGIAVLDHPTNAVHPPGWRVDEQGLINPNVSSVSDWKIPAGEQRRFRHRLLIYRNAARSEWLKEEFSKYSNDSSSTE